MFDDENGSFVIAKLTGKMRMNLVSIFYVDSFVKVNFRSVAFQERHQKDPHHKNYVTLFPGQQAAPGNEKLSSNYKQPISGTSNSQKGHY